MTRLHTWTAAAALLLAACSSSPSTARELSARRMAPTTTTTTITLAPTTTTVAPTTTTTTTTAVPRPAPAPAPAPAPSGCPSEIVDAVHRHFDRFGTDVAEWFVTIVWRESNCRPDVVSPTGCYGLAQLALGLHADLFAAQGLDWRSSWMDPDANLEAAALLYASSGASPWRL